MRNSKLKTKPTQDDLEYLQLLESSLNEWTQKEDEHAYKILRNNLIVNDIKNRSIHRFFFDVFNRHADEKQGSYMKSPW